MFEGTLRHRSTVLVPTINEIRHEKRAAARGMVPARSNGSASVGMESYDCNSTSAYQRFIVQTVEAI